jgi:hypothetical protein
MDEDLETLSREQLIDEIRRLRAGIRAHRDSSGHDLCWHHPQLWACAIANRWSASCPTPRPSTRNSRRPTATNSGSMRQAQMPTGGNTRPVAGGLVINALAYLAGGIFVLLAGLHGVYTYLDARKPRRIVPDDPAVIAAMTVSKVRLSRGGTDMWSAWLGFNFSHSIGGLLFGAICILIGVHWPAVPSWALPACAGVAAIYLWVGLNFWFRVPNTGIAIATACLLIAWILSLQPFAQP